jgi:predicted TPR repeat methyltransferase
VKPRTAALRQVGAKFAKVEPSGYLAMSPARFDLIVSSETLCYFDSLDALGMVVSCGAAR